MAQYIDKLQTNRLTLTPPVINHASNVIFLIAGGDKAAALRSVWYGPHDPDRFPAQIVRPAAGHVIWLVDQAASR
jgi:6-phosphogluconolactonase